MFRLVEDGWSEEVSLEVTQLHAADENLTRYFGVKTFELLSLVKQLSVVRKIKLIHLSINCDASCTNKPITLTTSEREVIKLQ